MARCADGRRSRVSQRANAGARDVGSTLASAGDRERPAASMSGAHTVAEVLATPILAGARLLAGHAGVERMVERLNVMEVPDILPWVKPHEFLLTTAYPLRESPEALVELVGDLDDAGLAGLGVKLGRYLDELPEAALAAADDRGFPVVQLPDGVGFDEIFNEVLTGILNRQALRLEQSERIHHAFLQIVLRGDGLDSIATELAGLLARPVVVVGADGVVLAVHDHPELAPGARVRVGEEELLIGDERLPGAVVPISAGPHVHGNVVALGDRPVDRMALESAATVAALVITKRMELEAVESKYQSDLMHDLLTGRVDDDEAARARARMFGWDLDRRLIALVVRIDDPPALLERDEMVRPLPLATSIRQLVTERDPSAAIVRFSDEAVVLTAAFDGDDGRTAARRFAASLAEAARRPVDASVSVGLSRPVTDLRGIPAAYAQATRALRIGASVRGPGAATHFDDLGIYRILTLIDDPEELRSFADEALGELARDTAQAADLRHTLEVLLETNFNVAEAARRLHFHYNTLRYRVEKLESILGPVSEDATTRLNAQVALLIHQMEGL